MKKLLFLIVGLLLALIVVEGPLGKKLFKSAPSTAPEARRPSKPKKLELIKDGVLQNHRVPPMPHLDMRPKHLANGEVLTTNLVMQVIAEIAEKKYFPDFTDPMDVRIHQLASEYVNGQRDMMLYGMPDGFLSASTTMAYNCNKDVYAIRPNTQTSKPFLALVIYHEMAHAVECIYRKQGIEVKTCTGAPDSESLGGWAAGIRMFDSWIRTRYIEEIGFTNENLADATGILLFWKAFLRGRFCDEYLTRTQSPTQDIYDTGFVR